LAKQKEKTDQKESTAAAPASEAPAPVVKPSTKSVKVGKLAPKNKSRVPRRLKKAQHKAAGRH